MSRRKEEPVRPPKTRTQIPKLAVLPVAVLAAVTGIPMAFGVNPVRWDGSSPIPKVVAEAGPEAKASPVPEFADPIINPAEPLKPEPPVPSGSPEPPVPHVAQPWKPGMTQWGVQLYWEDMASDGESEIRGKARRLADYVVSLGANAVSLSYPVYTSGIDANSVFAGPKTPTAARMEPAVETLAAAGLRITLRPILDERVLLPEWRGAIRPPDKDAWFASYRDLLVPYAEMAQRHKVATIVLGVELESMEHDDHWTQLIATLRGGYQGELAYDTNYPNFLEDRSKVPADVTGVDAYFPVKAPDNASVETIVAGWNTWLDKRAKGPMPGTLLAETGIGAQNGAFSAPGDFYRYGPVNPKVQATWYRAVCRVAKDRQMAGLYWWAINFHDDPATAPGPDNSRLDFAGRPQSEEAIRECFGGGAGTAGPNPTGGTTPTGNGTPSGNGTPTGSSTTRKPTTAKPPTGKATTTKGTGR
jgi:hypothetical protein